MVGIRPAAPFWLAAVAVVLFVRIGLRPHHPPMHTASVLVELLALLAMWTAVEMVATPRLPGFLMPRVGLVALQAPRLIAAMATLANRASTAAEAELAQLLRLGVANALAAA